MVSNNSAHFIFTSWRSIRFKELVSKGMSRTVGVAVGAAFFLGGYLETFDCYLEIVRFLTFLVDS